MYDQKKYASSSGEMQSPFPMSFYALIFLSHSFLLLSTLSSQHILIPSLSPSLHIHAYTLTCSHTHTHKQGHTQTWAGACRGRTGSVLQGQHLSWAPWAGSGWPAAPCCPRVASEGSWGWGWRPVPAWPCSVCDLAPFTARHLTFIPPITVFPTMSRKWTPPMAHRVGGVCQPLGWSQTWG